jgi:hypothetical protein
MKSDPSLDVSTGTILGGPPTTAEVVGGGLRGTVLNPQDLP